MRKFLFIAAVFSMMVLSAEANASIFGGRSSKSISYLAQDTANATTMRIYTGKRVNYYLPGDSTLSLYFSVDRDAEAFAVHIVYDATTGIDTALNVTFYDVTDTLTGVMLTEYYTGDSLYVVFKGTGYSKSGSIPLNVSNIGRRVRMDIENPNSTADTAKSLYVRLIETMRQ